ncbi:hypothetical protein [Butyrivibrio sp. FCS014]|nr:hypothetical protein [Butyrivibrio sp. FCS014]
MKGNKYMSNREIAMELLKQVPEEKLYYIIGVIEGASIVSIFLLFSSN